MSDKLPITVLVCVKNEKFNLPKCLGALGPATRIIMLDSHSTDGSIALAQAQEAEVVQFDYRGGYPKKRQWAMNTLDLTTPWLLLVDADEVIPDQLWEEIGQAIGQPQPCDAYMLMMGFHFLGRSFRYGGFSFPAIRLFKKGCAEFEQIVDDPPEAMDMEVHERMRVRGRLGRLNTPVIHEDFKGLAAYLERHNQYSTWEAKARRNYLQCGHWGQDAIQPRLFGNPQERRRFLKFIAVRVPLEPVWWFLYHYFLRLGFLEGRPGFIASLIRAYYIFQVRAKMFEMNLRETAPR